MSRNTAQLPPRRRIRNRRPVDANIDLALASPSRALPLSMRFKTKVRYADSILMNAGASTPATYVFRANSLYDPDYTGVGHQPYSFDQLISLYDHACVQTAKLSVSIANTYGYPINIGISVADSATPPASIEIMREQALSRCQLLSTQASGYVKPIAHKVDVARFFGLTQNTLLASREHQCTASANPTEVVYFILLLQGQGNDDPTPMYAHVTLEFDVTFIEPARLPQS